MVSRLCMDILREDECESTSANQGLSEKPNHAFTCYSIIVILCPMECWILLCCVYSSYHTYPTYDVISLKFTAQAAEAKKEEAGELICSFDKK